MLNVDVSSPVKEIAQLSWNGNEGVGPIAHALALTEHPVSFAEYMRGAGKDYDEGWKVYTADESNDNGAQTQSDYASNILEELVQIYKFIAKNAGRWTARELTHELPRLMANGNGESVINAAESAMLRFIADTADQRRRDRSKLQKHTSAYGKPSNIRELFDAVDIVLQSATQPLILIKGEYTRGTRLSCRRYGH